MFSGLLTNLGCLFGLIKALLGEFYWGEALFYLINLAFYSCFYCCDYCTFSVFLRPGDTISPYLTVFEAKIFGF